VHIILFYSLVSFPSISIKNTTLICRNHIFDIDESILSPRLFEQLQCLLNQIAYILSFSLFVVNIIPNIGIIIFIEIHDGK
jgi:hypothetical protein